MEDLIKSTADLLTAAKAKAVELPKSREASMVITKIDEAMLWLFVKTVLELK